MRNMALAIELLDSIRAAFCLDAASNAGLLPGFRIVLLWHAKPAAIL